MVQAEDTPATPAPRNAAFPPAVMPTPDFPYRVIAKVGEGSMGTVYRAVESSLNRTVAIKVPITSGIGSFWEPTERQEADRRFLQEARSAAAIQHPGAVTIHRVGQVGDVPYIAMEWLDGEPLSHRLAREGMLGIDSAVSIAMQILDTLQAAHDAGVIHRDIKPANIVVLTNGRVKVVDFGIAQYRTAGLVETQAGIMLGTPFYASPEQLRGEAIDPRSDLFSVAVVLHEMLTGRRPFLGDSLHEFLTHLLTDEPGHVRALRPEVPAPLDAVVHRGLSRDRAERWPSARAMATALRGVLGDSPTPGDPFPVEAVEEAHTVRVVERSSYPVICTSHGTLIEAINQFVHSWPVREFPPQPAEPLLRKLLDRPLHAAPFSGAVELGATMLLIHDGKILGALAKKTGGLQAVTTPDLPANATPRLFSPAADHPSQLVGFLAALAYGRRARQSVLDSSIISLAGLAAQLSKQSFNGSLRLTSGNDESIVLFDGGHPLLGLVLGSWPGTNVETTWSKWAATVAVQLELEALDPRPLPLSHSLRNQDLEITCRWEGEQSARATSAGMVTRRFARLASRVTDTTRHAVLDPHVSPGSDPADLASDPAVRLLRWLLEQAPKVFSNKSAGGRWKYLAEWIPLIRTARLHHHLPTPDSSDHHFFDLVTQDSAGKVLQVATMLGEITPSALATALERAVAAKRARLDGGDIGSLLIVAPSFPTDVIESYLAIVEASTHGTARMQESFTGYAGFVRLGTKRGFHLLLVEDKGDTFEPILE